jgi:NAD(P)-dependent dehydrogenase (short-subunit alcohol dehydrogenase family)
LLNVGCLLPQLIEIEKGCLNLKPNLNEKICRVPVLPRMWETVAAVDHLVAHVEREIGPIDMLVNVAGVLRTGLIHSLSDEDWEKTFSANSTGVFNVSRAVARRMISSQNWSDRDCRIKCGGSAADAYGRLCGL